MKDTMTGNAQAILDIVRAARNHPTAQEIYDEVRSMRPHIGLASVYRTLHALAEQGMIREIERSEESRYDGQIIRHDHAICSGCNTLIDLPDMIILMQEQLQTAAQAAGIELESHEVRLYGKCAACQTKQRQIEASSRTFK